VTQGGHLHPFDERAALAELERLRESIQAARQARQRTHDEFEAFVKSFRKPASIPSSEPPTPASLPPEVAEHETAQSMDPSLHTPDPLPAAVGVTPSAESLDDKTTLQPPHSPRRYRVNIRSLGIVAILGVIALGLLASSWRGRMSPPKTAKAVSDNKTVPSAARTSTSVASPAVPANIDAHGVTVELRAIRPVWMRVVVDGRKDAGRTVPAGEALRFTGDHSIVVRVGNGGDVLVKTGGREESFGDVGQPRTRTFSKP